MQKSAPRFPTSSEKARQAILALAVPVFLTLAIVFASGVMPETAHAGRLIFSSLRRIRPSSNPTASSHVSGSSLSTLQLNQNFSFTGSTTATGSQSVMTTATGSDVITQEVTGTGGNVNQSAASTPVVAATATGSQSIGAGSFASASQTGTGDQVNQNGSLSLKTAASGKQKIGALAGNTSKISQKAKKAPPDPLNANQQASLGSQTESTAIGEQDTEAESDVTFTQDADGGQVNQNASASVATESSAEQEVNSAAANSQNISQETENGTNSNQSATGSSTTKASAKATQDVSASNTVNIIQK